jgi:hypothetical protein
MRAANAIQTLQTAADVYANFGTYQADGQEAGAIEAIAKTQAALDIINSLESEIVKRQKEEEARDLKLQTQSSKDAQELSSRLFQYYDTACQVLSAGAV